MTHHPDLAARHSVFISYSRRDEAVALRVQAALAKAGILAWIDRTGIPPGTPDWEHAIRAAIKQARAMILLASPDSRQSPYVRDELDLALEARLQVYPIWVLGDSWLESIPLGRSRMQYIDARGANEPAAMQVLIATLQQLLRPTTRSSQEAAIPVVTLLATLSGHTEWVQAVAWSPNGTRLASASNDRTVRLWDASSGKPLATLSGHTYYVREVAWSPDGTRLASASGDETVRLWDASSGKPLATLSGHGSVVLAVAWSPDGTRLASGSRDQTVRIWKV